MSEWVGVVALVVAVVAIPITVWATRQWGNRRASVEFKIDSVSLLPENARSGLLELTYRDIPVEKPHLVSITLRNNGPRDLTSAMFHEGSPISLCFNQTFYGLTQKQGELDTLSPGIGASPSEARVKLLPGLLKRGDECSISAVLSGPVEVSINAPLIDTDISQIVRGPEDKERVVTVTLSVLGVTAKIPVRLPLFSKS